jgi:thiol-disulfide isomerase/thioredoxin
MGTMQVLKSTEMNLRIIDRKVIVILIMCAVACSCTRKPSGSQGWTLANNQRAQLSDYKGKVVLLDFYATWCEPCRAETPRLVALHKQFADQGLQVIGLNVGGEDDRAEVPAYAKQFGIEYPLAFPDDAFADKYLSDNQNIPQAYLFDRNGNIVKRFIGYSESSGAELERLVQTSLAPVNK